MALNNATGTIGSIFQPLDLRTGDIRLVRLLPGKLNTEICCELFKTNPRDRPAYRALSYAWQESRIQSSDKETRQLTVNGKHLKVKANLWLALAHLRSSTNSLVIWIDSLCIDQANTKERNHQVGHMREIFRGASEVLIWLGPDVTPTEQKILKDKYPPMTLVDRTKAWIDERRTRKLILDGSISFAADDLSADSNPETKAVYENQDSFYVLGNCPPPSNEMLSVFSFIRALCNVNGKHMTDDEIVRSYQGKPHIHYAFNILMDCSWWQRIWVVQETVLAPKASIILGSIVAPWPMLVKATIKCELHRHCCKSFSSAFAFEGENVLLKFSRTILDFADIKGISSAPNGKGKEKETDSHSSSRTQVTEIVNVNLLSLLWKFKSRKSSDDRDKVYALTGLVTNWEHSEPLEPDYSLDGTQVFRQTALHILQGGGCLDILIGNPDKTKYPQLPSWAPDWTSPQEPHEVELLFSTQLFEASLNSVADCHVVTSSIISLRGFRLSTVDYVSEFTLSKTDGKVVAVDTWKAWWAVCKWTPAKPLERSFSGFFDTEANFSDRFWRTLCFDLIRDPDSPTGYRRASCEDRAAFKSWLRYVDLDQDPRPKPASLLGESYLQNSAVNVMDHSIRVATLDRCFFTCSDDSIGLGPKQAQASDEVFILLGGRTPFILRSVGVQCVGGQLRTVYTLIGSCYIHGAMDGETMNGNHADNLEEILLR